MKEKIKTQKGFIQIPLLIVIIISIVVASAATTGVVLYKQGKLSPLIASVSQVFKETEDTKPEITSEEPQLKEEQPLLEEINQTEDSQTEQELKQARLEAEKAQAEAEKAQLEAERLRAEQEAQKLAEEQQKEEERLTEVYRNAMTDSLALLVKQFKIETDFCNGMVDFADLRIKNREKLKTFATNNIPDEEIVYILNGWHDTSIEYAKEMRDIFIEMKDAIQEKIDFLNNFSNKWAVFRGTISKAEFNEAVGNVVEPYAKIVEDTWDGLDKMATNWKKSMDENDAQFRGEVLPNLFPSSSPSYTYQPPPIYEIHYTPQQYNFLDDVYKRQQIEALNRIADELRYLGY